MGPVPNQPDLVLVVAVTATIGGVLLVVVSFSQVDVIGIFIWTLFSAVTAALAWSRR